MCWPHVNPVPSGAVGKDCQRRLLSRPRFVRACSATDFFILYCPLQCTWPLDSIVVFFCLCLLWLSLCCRLVARYSPVRNTLQNCVCSIAIHANCSYCVYNGEKLFWAVVLSRACAQHVILNWTIIQALFQNVKAFTSLYHLPTDVKCTEIFYCEM
jgi:hypothetical protein